MSIQTLVQGFAKNIRALKASDYKESSVRLQYIDRFWELLDWDVVNREQRPPQDVEVMIEPSMDSAEDDGLKSREPDYLFRLNGFPRFIVEAKKPAVDLDTDKKAIFQTKRYAWNATIPFAILTDFEQFRLYDTTLKPVLNEPHRGLVREFKIDFQDYPTQWDEFLATFGREAVSAGSLERLRARIKKVAPTRRLRTVDRMLFQLKGEEPVDKAFLGFLEQHRKHFARTIYDDNKSAFPDADTHHGAARLTEAVQRLIDRMVFMRVCEDRGISKWGKLQEMLERIGMEGGNFYQALCEEFHDLDRDYNGYLFKPHFSEELTVSDDVLADFVRTLYPPDGPWDFSAISDDILGIVYEKFLGTVVTVKRGHAEVEEKPEVRHAGGVYYTPRFVVDTIIRRVIGPQIAGKTPMQVLDVKVLDPACGSGSFLVAAFQYLINHCLTAITADPSLAKVPATPKSRKKNKEIAFLDKKGRWHLAPDFRATLLTSCLHGVDIDQQAVEVTVMSLYLKMLEGQLPANWQRDWVENQLLPVLDNNIRCGNSLIDHIDFDRYVQNELGGLFPEDDDMRFRINRFDWASRTRGFGRLLDDQAVKERGRKGFDCIIGNPPYIRVQELNKWAPDECEFYKWRYKSAKKGSYDIYVVFVEKCLELLSPNGLLGFIMPHRFWQAKYGEGLRKVIADGMHLQSVIDFGDQQVFDGVTTYTGIHVLSQKPVADYVNYAKIVELKDGRSQTVALDNRESQSGTLQFSARVPLSDKPWVFSDSGVSLWLDAVRSNHSTLGQITSKIAQGLVSGCDGAFYLERRGQSFYSKLTQQTHMLENDLLHTLLKGSLHIRRWIPDTSPLCVLFPYERSGNEFSLIEPSDFAKKYPRTWKYLQLCRTALEQREAGRFAGDRFYQYSRPQNFEVMDQAKILVPAIGQRAEYCIDARGEFYYVGSGGGGGGAHAVLPSIKIDLHYLCGLLNSKCLDSFLQIVTPPFHSGWYAYSKGYIAQIPIKLPTSAKDNKLADRIIEAVRRIMEAKLKQRDGKLSDRERDSLAGEIESLERRIDEAVFQLYGVEGLPGDSPKGTTKKTEQEYEQDWENAISQVPKLDDGELRKAVKPIMTPKQSERLAELNRKAQAGGLIDAEKVEQRELLHVYDKSMVVRAAVLAELNKRGFDVSKYVAP